MASLRNTAGSSVRRRIPGYGIWLTSCQEPKIGTNHYEFHHWFSVQGSLKVAPAGFVQTMPGCNNRPRTFKAWLWAWDDHYRHWVRPLQAISFCQAGPPHSQPIITRWFRPAPSGRLGSAFGTLARSLSAENTACSREIRAMACRAAAACRSRSPKRRLRQVRIKHRLVVATCHREFDFSSISTERLILGSRVTFGTRGDGRGIANSDIIRIWRFSGTQAWPKFADLRTILPGRTSVHLTGNPPILAGAITVFRRWRVGDRHGRHDRSEGGGSAHRPGQWLLHHQFWPLLYCIRSGTGFLWSPQSLPDSFQQTGLPKTSKRQALASGGRVHFLLVRNHRASIVHTNCRLAV